MKFIYSINAVPVKENYFRNYFDLAFYCKIRKFRFILFTKFNILNIYEFSYSNFLVSVALVLLTRVGLVFSYLGVSILLLVILVIIL